MASGRKQHFKSLRFSSSLQFFGPTISNSYATNFRENLGLFTTSSVNNLQKFKALTIIMIEQPVNLLTQTPTLRTHSRRLFAQTLDH